MKKPLVVVLLLALFGFNSALAQTGTEPEVFNVADYENVNPDLLNVYGLDISGATGHWVNFGLPAEGRRANLIFDARYYLQTNPDLQAAFGPTGYQAAANHFINQGLPVEGRRGSLEFDVKYYLANGPDLVAAYGANNYKAAAWHFLNFGFQGRKGSADFDINDYIRLYPDVKAAYGATGYQQAWWHWLRRGKAGGRVGVGAPAVSQDCLSAHPPIIPASNPPTSFTRIYLGYAANQGGDGTRYNNPDLATNADTFDNILRTYTGNPAATPAVPPTSYLIVCIGPGTFQTRGDYDFVINVPHNSNKGWAIGPHWRIHGFGIDSTTLQLADFVQDPPDSRLPPSGSNAGLATVSDDSAGVEVSDLTIDDNFPALKQIATNRGISVLNLAAVSLRSTLGGHWVHNINVINAAGEKGGVNETFEAFPVVIGSINQSPTISTGNVIEYVTMSAWGGGSCTAIVLANATGTIHFNVVDGYEKGIGGFGMGPVQMRDNFVLNAKYGFNIDSLNNDGVQIWFNEVRHPLQYGIVVGGGNTYSNFGIIYNTISIQNSSVAGIVLSGNVTNAIVGRNNILADGVTIVTPDGGSPEPQPPFSNSTGLWVFRSGNANNTIQYNQLSQFLPAIFGAPAAENQSCVFGNWQENGQSSTTAWWDSSQVFTPAVPTLPNTTSQPCVSGL